MPVRLYVQAFAYWKKRKQDGTIKKSIQDHPTRDFYLQLKDTLKQRGYSQNLIVISTKRFKCHNDIQGRLSDAAKKGGI